MALNQEDAITIAKQILQVVDYDIYKEVLSEAEDDPESFTLLDEIVDIIGEYVKINP